MPPEVCFSGHCASEREDNNIGSGASEEDISVGDNEPYLTLQTHSSEGSRLIISEKSLTSQSKCDPGVRDEDESRFTSTDMSPLLAPGWHTRMVLSCLFL